MEVVQALLAKGASPNINAMGVLPFLAAAGVGGGQRGGGVTGGAAAIALMDVLLQHGADVNAQVTGTKTYSLRNARSPSTNEGMTALHVAVQTGRADLVRLCLRKAPILRSPIAMAAKRSTWSSMSGPAIPLHQ